MTTTLLTQQIKAIVGLGNPGPRYAHTPHNIGFLILDRLAEMFNGSWTEKQNMQLSTININGHELLLIKPQTFMNNSGEILSHLSKRGIKIDNLFVVHDEIDFDFGKINIKHGGSARGHNGLRSLIAHGGPDFIRLRCGVGRPEHQADVGNFVIAPFKQNEIEINNLINAAIDQIQTLLLK